MATAEVLGPEPTNDAREDIEFGVPYVVEFTIEGVVPILFHRWSNEAVAEKAKAAKNSAAKKTDNVESSRYRHRQARRRHPHGGHDPRQRHPRGRRAEVIAQS